MKIYNKQTLRMNVSSMAYTSLISPRLVIHFWPFLIIKFSIRPYWYISRQLAATKTVLDSIIYIVFVLAGSCDSLWYIFFHQEDFLCFTRIHLLMTTELLFLVQSLSIRWIIVLLCVIIITSIITTEIFYLMLMMIPNLF